MSCRTKLIHSFLFILKRSTVRFGFPFVAVPYISKWTDKWSWTGRRYCLWSDRWWCNVWRNHEHMRRRKHWCHQRRFYIKCSSKYLFRERFRQLTKTLSTCCRQPLGKWRSIELMTTDFTKTYYRKVQERKQHQSNILIHIDKIDNDTKSWEWTDLRVSIQPVTLKVKADSKEFVIEFNRQHRLLFPFKCVFGLKICEDTKSYCNSTDPSTPNVFEIRSWWRADMAVTIRQ